MPKVSDKPKLTIISLRISDEERSNLRSLMEQSNLSVSEIMREALELFKAHHCGSRTS